MIFSGNWAGSIQLAHYCRHFEDQQFLVQRRGTEAEGVKVRNWRIILKPSARSAHRAGLELLFNQYCNHGRIVESGRRPITSFQRTKLRSCLGCRPPSFPSMDKMHYSLTSHSFGLSASQHKISSSPLAARDILWSTHYGYININGRVTHF